MYVWLTSVPFVYWYNARYNEAVVTRKKRRFIVAVLFALFGLAGYVYEGYSAHHQPPLVAPTAVSVPGDAVVEGVKAQSTGLATDALNTLEVKGRAPKTGYKRTQFSNGWIHVGMCDERNHILLRDLTNVVTKSATDCTVVSGILNDPYTAKVITFQRGQDTSDDVQIDHVVALSDAWQKGAQQLSAEDRLRFANDSLNLLAVDGKTNNDKSDSDAASWLPPNKDYRCRYVARQIAVKQKYKLWVTPAEKDAMKGQLGTCPDQLLPSSL